MGSKHCLEVDIIFTTYRIVKIVQHVGQLMSANIFKKVLDLLTFNINNILPLVKYHEYYYQESLVISSLQVTKYLMNYELMIWSLD